MQKPIRDHALSRRSLIQSAALGALPPALASRIGSGQQMLDGIPAVIAKAQEEFALRSVILTIHDGKGEIFASARGESEHGTPATTDMYFRTGAVSITYMAMILLGLADEGVLQLDEPIASWLPLLPDANSATPRMLAQMTAGYPDYVQSDVFNQIFYEDPFRPFSAEELIQFGLDMPRTFAPGTNWDYSHTCMVILGQVMEKATGQSLADLMIERVFTPLGLKDTHTSELPHMAAPALHSYSSERRVPLGIASGVSFYEEATTWNPSWTLPPGAVQYSTVADVASSFRQIGQGIGLSESGFADLTSTSLLGFGELLEGCANCHTLDATYTYGMGLVISHGWYLQNPMFAGCGATVATRPDADITICAAVTFDESAFDDEGNYTYGNSSKQVVQMVSEILLPDIPTPLS